MKKPQQKPQITTAHVERKVYSYELENVKLQFALRTDVKKEIKAFLQLIEKAAVELSEDLEKIK